ncbi:hypothetical protein RIF29_05535 [Crotalaria pallida]|uniref:Uncharacterized protein n=1 Tax=Crotalaria pallida TaxID=3830 RepID=A0AAN9J3L4_CROPI
MKANRNCPPHGEFQGYKEWYYNDPVEGNEEATNATAYTPIESSFVPSEGNGEAVDVIAYTPIESSFVPSESATVATNAETEMPKVSKTKRGKRPRVASGESSKASIDPKAKRVNGPKMDTTEPMESAPRTYDQILNLLTEPEIANMVKALSSTYDMMKMAREAKAEKEKALQNEGPSTQFSTTKEKK